MMHRLEDCQTGRRELLRGSETSRIVPKNNNVRLKDEKPKHFSVAVDSNRRDRAHLISKALIWT